MTSNIFALNSCVVKKTILNMLFFVLPFFVCGQIVHPINRVRGNSFAGSPGSSASLNVVTLGQQTVQFSNGNDYNNGKTYPGYYKVTVANDGPWMVSVRAVSPFFTPASQNASANIPAEIVSLKASTSAEYIPLSVAQQNLIFGETGSQGSSFFIDLKVNPSWNYSGGHYNQQIIFTLSPQ